MTFGDDLGWGSAKDETREVYDAFREVGGNFIDTANLLERDQRIVPGRVYGGPSPKRTCFSQEAPFSGYSWIRTTGWTCPLN
jgi:hypothetical protein